MLKIDNETTKAEFDETVSLIFCGTVMIFIGVVLVFEKVRRHIDGDLGEGVFASGVIIGGGGLVALHRGLMRL
jgi:hypothetical protein